MNTIGLAIIALFFLGVFSFFGWLFSPWVAIALFLVVCLVAFVPKGDGVIVERAK